MSIQTGRKRREYGPRAGRTYYAISEDKNTLYRFPKHEDRETAVAEKGLSPLGALEFRNLVAQDVDGKLTVVGHAKRRGRPKLHRAAGPRRGRGRPRKEATAAPGRRGPGRPRKVVEASAPAPGTQSAVVALTPEVVQQIGGAMAGAMADALRTYFGNNQNAAQAAATAQMAGVGQGSHNA